ncbi:MAG: flagellar filament capping protein FliD [Campylobacterales bacterium]|nr:flagellar filament capping protein FliD [Campylobacterales bacterium]
MGVSSLGVGSSILTQSVLDQLRAADDAKFVTPITLDLANTKDKQDSFALMSANMTNLVDSIDALKDPLLFNARSATVTGTSVAVTADSNSDMQNFNLTVNNLATKRIEESGAFAASTDKVATGAGSFNISVGGGAPITINYDATTSLDDLKNLIKKQAGDLVDATVLNVSGTASHLVLSAKNTGASQDISITDNSGLLNSKLVDGAGGMTTINDPLTGLPTGTDASFTFNGQAITRSSNQVNDLVTGYKITLNAPGSSDVSVAQDRASITAKIDSFVSKYNETMTELNKLTVSSTDSSVRGIFSNESTIKRMQSSIQNMLHSISGGAGSLEDYGFDIAKDGTLSVNKTTLNTKLDDNSANVQAFFSGGNFTKADNSVVALTGAFTGFSTLVTSYTSFSGILNQYKDSLASETTSLNDRKTAATTRLDARYEILKKQYAAYDSMIAKINSASSVFTQMTKSTTGN